MSLKFRMHEDDPRYYREPFEQFFNNCGSFNAIIHELNFAFERLGVLARTEEEADVVGFATGLKLDFGFAHKKRFVIGVWESNILPEILINMRRQLQANGNYEYFGLSRQISLAWETYGFPTETIDLGVDAQFWRPNKDRVESNKKFTILSVTACNFRSGIHHLLNAYFNLCAENIDFKWSTKLIIKNTEERATKLPLIIDDLKRDGCDIDYILERQTRAQLRDLYQKSHLVVYIPTNTSGGIPILEAAAMMKPCIVGDYCPTNIYPHTDTVPTEKISINQARPVFEQFGLPYTFPPGWINEDQAKLNFLNEEKLANAIYDECVNFQCEEPPNKAIINRMRVEDNWTWDKSAEKLVKIFENKYN